MPRDIASVAFVAMGAGFLALAAGIARAADTQPAAAAPARALEA